jgi:hypothetical protein
MFMPVDITKENNKQPPKIYYTNVPHPLEGIRKGPLVLHDAYPRELFPHSLQARRAPEEQRRVRLSQPQYP